MRVLTQEEFDLLDNVSGAFWDEESPMEEVKVTALRCTRKWPPPPPPMPSLSFMVTVPPLQQEMPEAPCDGPVKSMSDAASEGDLIDDETGHNMNERGCVLENQVTREMFEDFAAALRAEYPTVVIVISGGDRYVDENDVVRSSSNGAIVPGAAQNGGHNHGMAVDFVVTGATLDRSPDGVVDRVAKSVGFTEFKGDYKDGHFHVSRPYPDKGDGVYLPPDNPPEEPRCHPK